MSQGSLNMESDKQGGLSYWGKEKTLALSCENTGLQRHPWALPGANLGGYRWANASGYPYTLKICLHTLPNVLKEQNERGNCLQEFMCI